MRAHPAVPVLAIFLLLGGCKSAAKNYVIASESFASAVDGLTKARQTGLIDDTEEWNEIKKTANATDVLLDEWRSAIVSGKKYPKVGAVLKLVAKLGRIYGVFETGDDP